MTKRIDISVHTSPGGTYMAKSRDERGQQVAYAYGTDRREATSKVVQRVRKTYPDAQVSF